MQGDRGGRLRRLDREARRRDSGFATRALSSKPWDSKDDANKVPDDGWLVKAQNLHTQRIDLVANATCKRPAQ